MGYKQKWFHSEDSQAAAQVAQGGCAVPIHGGFQDPAEQSPERPGLISQLVLLGAGGWTRDLLKSPPTTMILC